MKLAVPEKILTQHLVVLGKTGKGKSSVLRHIVEHLLSHGKRVCIIDPKGDWWGLKSDGSGMNAGFPIIAFGDFKEAKAQDVPINPQSGKHVAELITSGNRPCIIGFRGWMPGQMIKFWLDFAPALFNANSGELYLVGDEFHNFAPKGKVLDPDFGKCLHWSNRVMSEGRGIGLICLIASQRPQKVHNDTLTCCETLVALGVTHASDRAAVKDWIDGCGDPVHGKKVLDSLAGLARGEAYVWSPEIRFGPELVTFPMFETFDSFAPPQLQKKVSNAGWADVDLDEVKGKLAKVIEEARANDPEILKAEVRKLKAELSRGAAVAPAVKVQMVEVAVLQPEERALLGKAVSAIERAGESVQQAYKSLSEIRTLIDSLGDGLQKRFSALPQRARSSTENGSLTVNRAPAIRRPVPSKTSNEGNGILDRAQHRILDTIAMLGVRGLTPNREMIARWMDIHPKGGTYGQNLAYLRREGFIDGFELTDRGQQHASPIETGLVAVNIPLDPAQQRIVDVLSGGQTFDRITLAEALELHPKGGTYGQNLARLRIMGLIPERGPIELTEAAYK